MPRCPCCNKLMTRVIQENVRMSTCPECFGTWIDRVALMHLTRTPVPLAADGSSDPSLQELAAIVVESNTTERLHCPVCPVDLVKERYHPLIPVDINRCPRCAGVWLDVGELPLLRRLFTELLTSMDPEVVALRDKVGTTGLATEQMRERTRELQDMEPGGSPPGPGGETGLGGSTASDVVEITMDFLISLLGR